MKYKNLFLWIIGVSNLSYLFIEILKQTAFNTFAILSILFLTIANITAIILWMIPNKIIEYSTQSEPLIPRQSEPPIPQQTEPLIPR